MKTSLTGFTSPNSLVLFLLVPCAFALFSLSTIRFLYYGNWRQWDLPAAPGEKIWFEGGFRKFGMQLHLWSVIPAGILLPLQFLPVMRRKFMYAHKVAGRALFVMLMVGNITAIAIANRSFGGTLDTQCFAVLLAISTSVSVYKAWKSIRELKIDSHREWVLRTWAYTGSILSLRIVMVFLILGITAVCPNRFHFVLTCEELAYLYRSNAGSLATVARNYPTCGSLANGLGSADVFVPVPANWSTTLLENRTAILNLVFGPSGVVGYFINVFLLEIYLKSTRDEGERLRKVSEVRRRAAGLEKKEQ